MTAMAAGERVVIVGGGAIGLATGYFLQRAGAEVVVLDRGHVGDGASRGNAGWVTPVLSGPIPAPSVRKYALRNIAKPSSPLFIPPRPDPALALWLWRFWRYCNRRDHAAGLAAMAELNRRTMPLFDELRRDGVEFAMWQKGLLFAFLTEQGAAHELASLREMARFGYEVPDAPLDSSAVHQLEPALSQRVSAGFLLAGERHVDPQTLTRGLADRLRQGGAVIRERLEVTDFETKGDRVVAAISHGERIEADRVLLAAGAWTRPLARKLGVDLPVQGAKGYSFTVRTENPPAHPLYFGDVKVGVSSYEDGRTRIAGTMELSGLNEKIHQGRVRSIAEHARTYLGDWAGGPIEDVWGGMRPLTYDGLPVIGGSARYANVYVSTGHAMLGITLAPATGETLAELIATGRSPGVLRPFTPQRFHKGWKRHDEH
ncbi:FAD-binding oxidoreductase [Amycolatopsis sp. 195334CR]|uniref:NAD(P)/FAD-dependent oxidoreductase n=1 Tax=Amycolatopsis sp. 195334CR TaxID=2814588 RepID=UPI001A8E0329|nr:FAD-dependent oxidoreductase [Amycolatopsis sp. 195334CR]MBN6038523.1 FAD-dependent oxidoreductase [Amycolatopsis sp. 195334CR]